MIEYSKASIPIIRQQNDNGQKSRTIRWAIASSVFALMPFAVFILGMALGVTGCLANAAGLVLLLVLLPVFFVSPFCGIIAGHIASYRIRKASGMRADRSALIGNYFLALLMVFLFLVFAPSFIESSRKSRRRSCIENMRVINVAMVKYRADHTNGPAIMALSNLVPGYIKIEPRCPNASRKSYVIDCTNVVHCPVENRDEHWPHRLE